MSTTPDTDAINRRWAECTLHKRPFVLTEAEWLACDNPRVLLESLRGKASDRKVTLFAVACYRRIWHLADEPCRNVVNAVERFVDEGIGEEEVATAYAAWDAEVARRRGQIEDGAGGNTYTAVLNLVQRGTPFAAEVSDAVASAVAFDPYGTLDPIAMTNEGSAHAALVREIFGNPFRAITFQPAWAKQEILDLGQSMIRERRFQRMPELGEALLAAGCDDQAILAHCKESGHVLGCWVLDLLTNRL